MRTCAVTLCLVVMQIFPQWSQAKVFGSPLSLLFAVSNYPDGHRFLTPQAICVDPARGDVYVADTGNGRIVVFDLNGRFVLSFNHRAGADRPSEPVGVAVDRTGRVFVTDTSSHQVYIYDFRGRLIGKITPDSADGDALFGRMAADASGRLYVTVRNRGQVFVYDSEGVLRQKIGETQVAANRIEMASDVALDAKGRIYVLSSLGDAVTIFSPTGSLLSHFGVHAPGEANFSFPTAMDIDGQGKLWIVDSFAHCVKGFKASGSFVSNVGGFVFPVDIAVWAKGERLFVLEKSAQRLSGYAIGQEGPGT